MITTLRLVVFAALFGGAGCAGTHTAISNSPASAQFPDRVLLQLNVSLNGDLQGVVLRDPLGRIGSAPELRTTTIPGFDYGSEPASPDPENRDELLVLVVPNPVPGDYVLSLEGLRQGSDQVAVSLQASTRGSGACAQAQFCTLDEERRHELKFELRPASPMEECRIEVRD